MYLCDKLKNFNILVGYTLLFTYANTNIHIYIGRDHLVIMRYDMGTFRERLG
jgi:hypothetical protein